jgi:hypothetical protein
MDLLHAFLPSIQKIKINERKTGWCRPCSGIVQNPLGSGTIGWKEP